MKSTSASDIIHATKMNDQSGTNMNGQSGVGARFSAANSIQTADVLKSVSRFEKSSLPI